MKNKKNLKKNPLEFGARATLTQPELNSKYLDGMVSGIEKDNSYKRRIEWPEMKFKKRYLEAFTGIINEHFINKELNKQVIVLVSHHKGIKHLVKYASNHTGIKIDKVKDPDYCFTIKFMFDSTPSGTENFTMRNFEIIN